MTVVTHHARKRLKERSGLKKKSMQRMADKAYQKGIKYDGTKGEFKKWISNIYFRNTDADNIRIYGDKLFLFTGDILITVLQIPSRFTNNMSNYLKNQKSNI